MRILWLATKAPWPSTDGGRLVAALTIEALADLGNEVVVGYPTSREKSGRVDSGNDGSPVFEPRRVDVRPVLTSARARLPTLVSAAFQGVPYTAVRHRHPAMVDAVRSWIELESFDAIGVEQPHALASLPLEISADKAHSSHPGREKEGPRLILRAQNVESDLWRKAAERSRGARRLWLHHQYRLVTRWERAQLEAVHCTVALTSDDAERLSAIAPTASIATIPAPFDAGRSCGPCLPGEPALTLLGDLGWHPNRDGLEWFLHHLWPGVLERHPKTRLHLFCDRASRPAALESGLAGVVLHDAPADSRTAFAKGSILLVPLRIASGVRMKILEGWSRGIPVLATPQATAGLEAPKAVAQFSDLADLVEQLDRLRSREVREDLVRRGRTALERHDPRAVAQALEGLLRTS